MRDPLDRSMASVGFGFGPNKEDEGQHLVTGNKYHASSSTIVQGQLWDERHGAMINGGNN